MAVDLGCEARIARMLSKLLALDSFKLPRLYDMNRESNYCTSWSAVISKIGYHPPHRMVGNHPNLAGLTPLMAEERGGWGLEARDLTR